MYMKGHYVINKPYWIFCKSKCFESVVNVLFSPVLSLSETCSEYKNEVQHWNGGLINNTTVFPSASPVILDLSVRSAATRTTVNVYIQFGISIVQVFVYLIGGVGSFYCNSSRKMTVIFKFLAFFTTLVAVLIMQITLCIGKFLGY